MGLLGAAAQRDLRAVKGLRNLFAHAENPVRFTSVEVIAKAKKLFTQDWMDGASVRALFDAATDRSEVAISARINGELVAHATRA